MAIVRWSDPFRDLTNLQDKMSRLLEDTFEKIKGRDQLLSHGLWSPAVDIYETDENIVLTAEIPGVNKDEITIEVKDGILVIKGERKFEKHVREENYHLMECAYGFFRRSFSLPAGVIRENVSATYRNGVLEVILPKTEEVKPKQIDISNG